MTETTMPRCPHNEYCGGCIYQGVPYEEQLQDKELKVRDLLAEAQIVPSKSGPIVPSPSLYRYRNKMEYTFGDFVKDGEMTLGMHRPRSFLSIVTVDECQLVHEDFNKVLRATLDFCVAKGYRHYNKKRHDGLLRHLILRRGVHTGELLVTIVTTAAPFDEAAYEEMLRALAPALEHELVGVLRIIDNGVADAVQCEELRVLAGRSYYNEVVMGLRFQVGVLSFFQTNVAAVERLYTDAINIIENYEDKVVYDLFCGTGTITQSVAQKAKMAVGVEIVPEAVEMARESARLNGIDNCRFLQGDVFEVLQTTSNPAGEGALPAPDVILVDPPRPGVGIKAMEKILSYGVEQIVYISCNYKTLIRDLAYAVEHGYRVDDLRPYDNFPFTKHIECIVYLTKQDERSNP